MARPPSRYPTELELEILKVVWDIETATVRQVHDALIPKRKLAYNTVLTMMTIMTRKGYLKRTLRSNGLYHVYKAKVTKENISRGMLHDIVTRVFSGSAFDAALNLIKSEEIDAAGLKELRKLVDEKEKAGK